MKAACQVVISDMKKISRVGRGYCLCWGWSVRAAPMLSLGGLGAGTGCRYLGGQPSRGGSRKCKGPGCPRALGEGRVLALLKLPPQWIRRVRGHDIR